MNRILSFMLAVFCSIAGNAAFSKNIDLLSEPRADSKITGKINTEKVVTIVYTPQSGDWIKVANPENGDVGWVKSNELGNNRLNMHVMTSNDGSHSYSVYQVGSNAQSDQKLLKEMQMLEQQQYIAQARMAHLINDMFNFPFHFTQPLIVPVIMQPNQPSQQKAETVNSVKPVKTT